VGLLFFYHNLKSWCTVRPHQLQLSVYVNVVLNCMTGLQEGLVSIKYTQFVYKSSVSHEMLIQPSLYWKTGLATLCTVTPRD
jgi:hypothetical protein